jgi:hypothetical protein
MADILLGGEVVDEALARRQPMALDNPLLVGL